MPNPVGKRTFGTFVEDENGERIFFDITVTEGRVTEVTVNGNILDPQQVRNVLSPLKDLVEAVYPELFTPRSQI